METDKPVIETIYWVNRTFLLMHEHDKFDYYTTHKPRTLGQFSKSTILNFVMMIIIEGYNF